jgi:DNA-binding response OmpR family regulator
MFKLSETATNGAMKILVVEDHVRLGQLLRQGLSEHCYAVTWVKTCEAARDALSESSYDVIVLDLGLPDGDGIELLREWRTNRYNEPVLILSARDSVEDRIKGLDIGADDYLPKPFSFEELLAHVRALMRRQSVIKQSVLEHNGIQLDLSSHCVSRSGKAVELTGREFALFEIFMQHPSRVLTRTFISEKIWPSHYDIDMNLLDVYMSRLRNKFESGADGPVFKTVRGVGYMLI